MTNQEITRVDLKKLAGPLEGSTIVQKWGAGWYEHRLTAPVSTETLDPDNWTFDAMIDWFKANGWTVRQWPGGARAWRYELKPVRSAGSIKRLRDQLTERKRYGSLPEELQVHTLDLAYDW